MTAYGIAAGLLGLGSAVVYLLALAAIWLGLRLGRKPGTCVGLGTFVLLALPAGLVLISGSGPALAAQWQREFLANLQSSLDVYRQLGWNPEELARTARWIRVIFISGAPGWLVLAALGLAAAGYRLLRRLAPGLPGAKIELKPFPLWSAPDHVIWVLLAGLAAFLPGIPRAAVLISAGVSCLVVALNLFLLDGLAIVFFFLENWKLPRAFRVLSVLALGLVPVLTAALALLGVTDTWWDWRRVKTAGLRAA